MIVRSPRNKAAPRQDAPDWPPKSPFHALLSSPSGRKKWQDSRSGGDRSTSPSSARKHVTDSQRAQSSLVAGLDEEAETDMNASPDDPDGEDDEETLELKLQEIQARLRLKQAQAKKRKGLAAGNANVPGEAEPARDRQSKRQKVDDTILVPVSPPRKHQPAAAVPRSPARVLLGLGNRATDVSLKRASTTSAGISSRPHSNREVPKIKSFSERMAEGRAKDQARQDKDDRIGRSRSAAFDFNPSIRPERHTDPNKPARSEKVNRTADPPRSTKSVQLPDPDVTSPHGNEDVPESDASFDPYSSLHLSKRHMEHTDVSRILDDKEVYTLPRLLKDVKAPEYEPPECETDYVVLGVLASKSSPYDTKQAARPPASNDIDKDNDADTNRMLDSRKFMVLKLVDLDWELDLFLFGHAFREHWKLTPGTLLAILNPEIMPPKANKASGRFSLKLNSSEDRVLEIGVARDLGYCKSVKRDGATCSAWVNRRKTEFCDYHVNMMLEKTRAGRMEVNGMARGRHGAGPGPGPSSSSTASRSGKKPPQPQGGGRRKDPETGEWYYAPAAPTIPGISASGLSSASSSLSTSTSISMSAHIPRRGRGPSDEQDYSQLGLSTRQLMDLSELARPEQMRKRLAAKERERAAAVRLGALGNGIGAEYLRLTSEQSKSKTKTKTCSSSSSGASAGPGSGSGVRGEEGEKEGGEEGKRRPDASALGLIATPASRSLGPSATAGSGTGKRKRGAGTGPGPGPGLGKSAQVGWGGAFQRGLLDGKKVIPLRKSAVVGQLGVLAEKGQRTLRGMVAAGGDGDGGGGAEESIAAGGSMTGSGLGSPVIGRVRKKARLDLGEQGIKEPGRESFGQQDQVNDDSEDGDELDIVM